MHADGSLDLPRLRKLIDWHIENGTNVLLASGFEPGRIYEVVYNSENPPVAGTGLAGTGNPAPASVDADRTGRWSAAAGMA